MDSFLTPLKMLWKSPRRLWRLFLQERGHLGRFVRRAFGPRDPRYRALWWTSARSGIA